MFLEVVRKACVRDFGHRVIGEASSGLTAIGLIERLRPQVLILDLSLPERDGFEVAAAARTSSPATKILVLSSYPSEYALLRLERLAVNGFVDKNTNSLAAVGEALKAFEGGKVYFSKTYRDLRYSMRADPYSFSKILSETEYKIMQLISSGLDDQEIGRLLNITHRTAQTHRSNILKKLGLKGTPKLMAFALKKGFKV